MIIGVVKGDEARIRLTIRGARGRQHEVDAILDTGFTASLTLPPAVVAELALPWRSVDTFTLADGNESDVDVYAAQVEWDGRLRTVLVHAADADPLIGMRLLRGCELKMLVRHRGRVMIRLLRPR